MPTIRSRSKYDLYHRPNEMKWIHLAPIALLAFVSGCTTTLPQTYTIQLGDEVARLSPSGKTLHVDEFSIASTYARQNFVYRTSPYRVHFDPVRRWAVPPEEMLREQVQQRLKRSGLFKDVTIERGIVAPDYVLRCHILAFGETMKGKVRSSEVTLRFELLDNNESEIWSSQKSESKVVGSREFESVIEAISKSVAGIVDQCASDLKSRLGG